LRAQNAEKLNHLKASLSVKGKNIYTDAGYLISTYPQETGGVMFRQFALGPVVKLWESAVWE
jgi:hypothetical protein